MPDSIDTGRDVETYLEREVKLNVPATFVLPVELTTDQPDRARYEGRQQLRAIYYDTDDLRLARNGITFRHRSGEGKPLWTLKIPADSGIAGERVERSVPGGTTMVAPELADLVRGHTRSAPLTEVAKLTTRRDVWSLTDPAGNVEAELVDDLVSVVKHGKVVARFRELEIERKGIDDAAFDALVARLEALGATRHGFSSKLARALGPRGGAPADVPEPIPVRKKDPAGALVVFLLRRGVRRLISQDIGVRLGHDDAIHQMRVACRRLRSDLRTFAELFEPGTTDALRDELAWLADVLGDARDIEVLRERLARTFAADPLSPLDPVPFARLDEIFHTDEQRALRRVAEALHEQRYVALLDLAVAIAREPRTTERAKLPAHQVFPSLVGATVADLDKKVRALTSHADDHRWHTARIRAKRARYAAEACAGALGKHAARTGSAMAAVQDVLGEHQDAAVAAERLIAIAHVHPADSELVLLCGRLTERERGNVRKSRKQFGRVWKAASRPAVRGWLAGDSIPERKSRTNIE